jgi:hypothetical protein
VQSDGGEGPAKVTITNRGLPGKRTSFVVSRDASVHWSSSERSLFVEDMHYSDTYRVLIFDLLASFPSETLALKVNATVRKTFESTLAKGDRVIYYLPRFVAWQRNTAVISLGVTTVHGETGPFTPHCVGYVVDVRTSKITESLDRTKLEKEFSADCQISP